MRCRRARLRTPDRAVRGIRLSIALQTRCRSSPAEEASGPVRVVLTNGTEQSRRGNGRPGPRRAPPYKLRPIAIRLGSRRCRACLPNGRSPQLCARPARAESSRLPRTERSLVTLIHGPVAPASTALARSPTAAGPRHAARVWPYRRMSVRLRRGSTGAERTKRLVLRGCMTVTRSTDGACAQRSRRRDPHLPRHAGAVSLCVDGDRASADRS